MNLRMDSSLIEGRRRENPGLIATTRLWLLRVRRMIDAELFDCLELLRRQCVEQLRFLIRHSHFLMFLNELGFVEGLPLILGQTHRCIFAFSEFVSWQARQFCLYRSLPLLLCAPALDWSPSMNTSSGNAKRKAKAIDNISLGIADFMASSSCCALTFRDPLDRDC